MAKSWLMEEGERFLIGRKDTKVEVFIECVHVRRKRGSGEMKSLANRASRL